MMTRGKKSTAGNAEGKKRVKKTEALVSEA